MANDNKKLLYDELSKRYDLGSFDQFQQDIADDTKRRKLYDATSNEYDYGDYESFSKQLGFGQVQQQQVQPAQVDSATNAAVFTEGTLPESSLEGEVTDVAPSKPAEPAKPKFQLTPEQQAQGMASVNQIVAQGDASVAFNQQRLQNMQDYWQKGGMRTNFQPVERAQFNPETGQVEKTYVNAAGGETASKADAEQMSHRVRVAQGFSQRMTDNGLDPNNPEDVQRQHELDLSEPVRNEMDKLWSEAESKHKEDVEASKKQVEALRGVNPASLTIARAVGSEYNKDVSRFTRFDMQKMMDSAWANLGEHQQQEYIGMMYDALKKKNPGKSEQELQKMAQESAREYSDSIVYQYAVDKNVPKSTLDFFADKVKDTNLIYTAVRALARKKVGSTGDMLQREQAMNQYGSEHRFANIAGTVTGMAIDPTMWVAGGIGSLAGKGALNLTGRLMLRGALKGGGAARYAAGTLAGRLVQGTAGGAVNFGAFEGMKNIEQQALYGGYINPQTGQNEGYSIDAVLNQTKHGLMMGAATGSLSPIIGNFADKAVKATASTAGKVGVRAGETLVSTLAEGTIFSIPEWIEGERSAADVWTDNMAMMLGFKAQHMIKSAPRVLRSLKTEDKRYGLSFEERVRRQLDASPSDIGFTREELEELRDKGYGDLGMLFARAGQKSTKAKPNSREVGFQVGDEYENLTPNILYGYDDMQRLMADNRVSEAARAKAYYIVTGHTLPMHTVVGYTTDTAEDGTVVVNSTSADGSVITSRKFANAKAAQQEIDKITRQAELNSVNVGEQYRENKVDDSYIERAIKEVIPNGDIEAYKHFYNMYLKGDVPDGQLADVCKQIDQAVKNSRQSEVIEAVKGVMGGNSFISINDETLQFVDVVRLYEQVRNGDKADKAHVELFQQIESIIHRNRKAYDMVRPEDMRKDLLDETGIDVDKVLSTTPSKRTKEEQAVVERYVQQLFPKNHERHDWEFQKRIEEQGQNYEEGRSAVDTAEQTGDTSGEEAIVERYKAAQQEISDVFGDMSEEVIAAMNDDPVGSFQTYGGTSQAETDAMLEYINSRAAFYGMIEASKEGAEGKIAEAQFKIQQHTHQKTGMVHPAVMKGDDHRQVYIVSGNVVMFPDGTAVDTENSSSDLIICDAQTGEISFTSADRILSADEPVSPDMELEAVTQGINAERGVILGGAAQAVQEEEQKQQQFTEQGIQNAYREDLARQTGSSTFPVGGELQQTLAAQMQYMQGQGYAQQYQQQQAEAQRQAELDKERAAASYLIPKDKNGTPMLEQAPDPQTAWQGAVEYFENEDDATEYVQGMVAGAEKDVKTAEAAVKKAETAAKGVKPSGDMAAFKEQKAQTRQALADAQQQLADAQARLQQWQAIGNVKTDQIKAEQQARNQQLHDEAVARAQEEQRIAQQKADEQAALGANAVAPQIREKWESAPKVVGVADEKTLPDGSTLAGHYVLTEAGATTASHDVENAFTPSEGFPVDENGNTVNDRDYEHDQQAQQKVRDMAGNFDSRAAQDVPTVSQQGVVYDGANRTMSGNLAAKNGTDQAYIDYLNKYGAKFGFTPEQIGQFKHPRISFVLDEELPYDAPTFARFNAQKEKTQNVAESAVKMGKIVPDKTFSNIVQSLAKYDNLSQFFGKKDASDAIMELLRAGVINDMQLPALMTGDNVSDAGKGLLLNTLIGKVFQGNPDAVRQIIAYPNVRQSIVMGMNEIAHNSTLSNGYDISAELADAIDLVYRAKTEGGDVYKEGEPISPYGRQLGLDFEGEGDHSVTDALTLILADLLNSSKPSDLRKLLALYNEEATAAASGQMDLFAGGDGVRSKMDLLIDRINQYKNATPREQQQQVDAAIEQRKRTAAERAEQTEPSGEGSGGEQAPANAAGTGAAQQPVVPQQPKRRGARQIEVSLKNAKQAEADGDLEKIADWLTRFDENVMRRGAEATPEEIAERDRLEKVLTDNGYEIEHWVGQEYSFGEGIDVEDFKDDMTLPVDIEGVISGEWKPRLKKDGKLIKKGSVYVTRNPANARAYAIFEASYPKLSDGASVEEMREYETAKKKAFHEFAMQLQQSLPERMEGETNDAYQERLEQFTRKYLEDYKREHEKESKHTPLETFTDLVTTLGGEVPSDMSEEEALQYINEVVDSLKKAERGELTEEQFQEMFPFESDEQAFKFTDILERDGYYKLPPTPEGTESAPIGTTSSAEEIEAQGGKMPDVNRDAERERARREERRQRILANGTGFDEHFGLVAPSEIKTAEDIVGNIDKIASQLVANEGKDNRFEGFAYGGDYAKNLGEQIWEYLISLSDVVPNELGKAAMQSFGWNSHQDVIDWAKKRYPELKTEQGAAPKPRRKPKGFGDKSKYEAQQKEERRKAGKATEEEQKEFYAAERERASKYSDDYADALRLNDTWQGAVGYLESKAEQHIATANDWASRQYKENTKAVEAVNHTTGEETVTTVGAANERRKWNTVESNLRQADELYEAANTLRERVGVPKEKYAKASLSDGRVDRYSQPAAQQEETAVDERDKYLEGSPFKVVPASVDEDANDSGRLMIDGEQSDFYLEVYDEDVVDEEGAHYEIIIEYSPDEMSLWEERRLGEAFNEYCGNEVAQDDFELSRVYFTSAEDAYKFHEWLKEHKDDLRPSPEMEKRLEEVVAQYDALDKEGSEIGWRRWKMTDKQREADVDGAARLAEISEEQRRLITSLSDEELELLPYAIKPFYEKSTINDYRKGEIEKRKSEKERAQFSKEQETIAGLIEQYEKAAQGSEEYSRERVRLWTDIRRRLSNLSDEELSGMSRWAYGLPKERTTPKNAVGNVASLRYNQKRDYKAGEEVLKKQGELPSSAYKEKKYNPFDFVGGKNKPESYRGIHHEAGYGVVTDGSSIVADKTVYDKSKEGKTVSKSGKELKGVFPNWQGMIPQETEKVAGGADIIAQKLGAIEKKVKQQWEAEEKPQGKQALPFADFSDMRHVILLLPNEKAIVMALPRLSNFIAASKHLGLSDIESTQEGYLYNHGENGYNLACPIMYSHSDTVNELMDEGRLFAIDLRNTKAAPVERQPATPAKTNPKTVEDVADKCNHLEEEINMLWQELRGKSKEEAAPLQTRRAELREQIKKLITGLSDEDLAAFPKAANTKGDSSWHYSTINDIWSKETERREIAKQRAQFNDKQNAVLSAVEQWEKELDERLHEKTSEEAWAERRKQLTEELDQKFGELSDEELYALGEWNERLSYRNKSSLISDEVHRRKSETGAAAFAEELLETQGELPSGEYKGKKYDPFNYVGDGKDREIYSGIGYRDGHAVATDGRILVADKTTYDKKKEGKTINKAGKELEGTYPNWKALFPEKYQTAVGGVARIAEKLGAIEAKVKQMWQDAKKNGEKPGTFAAFSDRANVVLLMPDGKAIGMRLPYLSKFVVASQHLGNNDINYVDATRFIFSQGANGSVLEMPVMVDADVNHDYTHHGIYNYFAIDLRDKGAGTGAVEARKEAQAQLIAKMNPAQDDQHLWVRGPEDIKTFDEVLDEARRDGAMYPDAGIDVLEEAKRTGRITVYSSKPIANGVFVSPSRMNAQDYAGDGQVYSAEVGVDDVAWLDNSEGQLARVDAQFDIESGEQEFTPRERMLGGVAVDMLGNAGTEVSLSSEEMESELGTPLKTKNGDIFGFVKDGKVYLDPKKLNPNTPIHEYTHLWDEALRANNPELWKRGVELMKQTPLWEQVKNDPAYADIANDENLLASEVHARLTGEKGAKLLDEMMGEANSNGTILDKAKKVSIIARLKSWLKEAWQWVKDTMAPWTKEEASKVTLDDFVNMTLKDMADGKNVSELRGVKGQKTVGKVTNVSAMEDMSNPIQFLVGRKRREEMERRLKKARPDMTEEQRQALFGILDGLEDTKLENATFGWFMNGSVRLPEDMDKIRQAVDVAGKAKVDPMQYKSPMALLEAHANFRASEKRINPDDVPTLHKEKDYGNGIVTYNVDESQESREAMREIINTHFGKDASPWCLLQGDGDGNLTEESEGYWQETYTKYPKRVAFQNGKLLAFFASNDKPTWWDRLDEPHSGIPLGKIKVEGDALGRSRYIEYNEETGETRFAGIYTRGHQGGTGIYEKWNEEGTAVVWSEVWEDGKIKSDASHWPNGEKNYEMEYYADGQVKRSTTFFEDGKKKYERLYDGGDECYITSNTQWYENGQKRSEILYYANSRQKKSNTQWYENGQKKSEELLNENGHIKSETEWFENGQKRREFGFFEGKWKTTRWTEDGAILNFDDTANDAGLRFRDGQDGTFKADKPVERKGNLIAVHNISVESLRKSLDLGGFPMPSIAITTPEIGHNDFGEISLVFGKESIDPSDRRNRVYTGDAWTPTFPYIDFKINDKVQSRITSKIYGLLEGTDYMKVYQLSIDGSNMHDRLRGWGGNISFADAYKDNTAMRIAFLKDKGIGFRPVTQEKKIGSHDNQTYEDVINKVCHGNTKGINVLGYDEAMALEPQLREIVIEEEKRKFGDRYEKLAPLLTSEDKPLTYSEVNDILYSTNSYVRNGGKKETDKSATAQRVNAKFTKKLQAEYEDWLDDLGGDIVEKYGIRNNVDPYTNSGNRRSWNALHDDVTLDNVVKAMQRQSEKGGDGVLGGNPFGAAQGKIGSMKELRDYASTHLAEISKEELDRIRQNIIDKISGIHIPGVKQDFEGIMSEKDIIVDALAHSSSAKGIYNYIHSYYPGMRMDIAEDIAEAGKEIRDMQKRYLEAKPARAVRLDEVRLAVVPKDADKELISELERRGVQVRTYNSKVDGARQKVLNKAVDESGLRFRNGEGRSTFSTSAEDFAKRQQRAVAEKGIVTPGLADMEVGIVNVPLHPFAGSAPISQARKWAKENLVKEYKMSNGVRYTITREAVGKYLSEKATKKSKNLGVHLAVLTKLPAIINTSIDAEVHPDYNKGADEERRVENGIGNPHLLVHRMYGAVNVDGTIYRVKTTMYEFAPSENQNNIPHSFEVKDLEVSEVSNTSDGAQQTIVPKGSNLPTETTKIQKDTEESTINAKKNVASARDGDSISVAELLNGIEKTHEPGKILLDASKEITPTSGDGLKQRAIDDGETELLNFLNGQPTRRGYRYAQWANYGVLPPMTAKVNGEWRAPMIMSRWEQSEEGMRGENGKTDLNQGNGRTTNDVAYNPYFHIRTSPLNDQFTAAYDRPELVVIEGEYPESELTSGYKAEGAKDGVGLMDWHSGSANGQLSDETKVQTMLSRYFKPGRIMSWSEVADLIAERIGEQDVHIPINTVPPMLRAELAKRGHQFGPVSGQVSEADRAMLEDLRQRVNGGEWDAGLEKARAYMDAYESSDEAKAGRVAYISGQLNTPVRVVSESEVGNLPSRRQRKAKGWYNYVNDEVVVVLPNNVNVADVDNTVVHEIVGHKGLRALIGEARFDEFLGEVYNHATQGVRKKIDAIVDKMVADEVSRLMAGKHGTIERAQAIADAEARREEFRKEATEEYMADMAGRIGESGFEKMEAEELTFWGKVKAAVEKFINRFLAGLGIGKSFKLGDKDLAYILYKSWKNLKNGGKPTMMERAEDAIMRDKTGYDMQVDEQAMFRDGDMGLDETITSMKADIASKNTEDRAARIEAMKAIGGNLSKLRQAMSKQRKYDIATAKAMTDLAKVLIDKGLLDNMSKFEVKRILSTIEGGVGKEDTSKSVQRLMDVMIDNQLRGGQNLLGKLFATRGSKVNARGVEVQGELDIPGQQLVKAARKFTSFTKEQIDNELIPDIMGRMADDSEIIADNAAIEYAGIQIARRYVEEITESKAEEKALREELRKSDDELKAGVLTREEYDQLNRAIEDAIRENKVERAESYASIAEAFGMQLGASAERAKMWREAEKQRIQDVHHTCNSDMQGRPADMHHRGETKAQKLANNDIVRLLLSPLGTFDMITRMFGKYNVNGEGYIHNYFMRRLTNAREKEIVGYNSAIDELNAKVSEIFGKKMKFGDLFGMYGNKLFNRKRDLPTATLEFLDGKEKKQVELTQGNMLYIYMVNKMTDGAMKLRKMGITEEQVDMMAEQIDPRFLSLADWIQEDFLVRMRDKYNEVHQRMFGASMAAIEHYFPLRVLQNALDRSEDVAQDDNAGIVLPGTTTGGIIKRTKNTKPLDILNSDAFNVLLEHLQEMEHWCAYAEVTRDINTMLSYKRFRNQVQNMTSAYGSGKTLWKNFRDTCKLAVGAYRPKEGTADKWAVNLAKGVTSAKVNLRLYTALKQLLSAPAYIPDSSPLYLAKNFVNPFAAWKWSMENLPIFRERWKSRISGDPILMKSEKDWKLWRTRAIEMASRLGMAPNAFVDAVTVCIGAHSIYETNYAKYRKWGFDEDYADKRARHDATVKFNETQQSSEGPYMSTIQADGTWFSRVWTIFRNSSMSYTRQTHDALRNEMKLLFTPQFREKSQEYMTKQLMREGLDEEQARKAAREELRKGPLYNLARLAIFMYVLPALWNLGSVLPYLIAGDDDDKKEEMLENALTKGWFGPVEGLLMGDVWSNIGNMIVCGEVNRYGLEKNMPIVEDAITVFEEWQDDNVQALNDLIGLLVQIGVGWNPQTLTDAVVAVLDACGDDAQTSRECALLIGRVLNCPPSQLDKIYFDELGVDGIAASKMTPRQIADRYARYKRRRSTPLTGWMYSEEGREQKESKNRTKAEKAATESFAAATDGADRQQLEAWREEAKQVAADVKRINQIEDENAQIAAEDSLWQTPAYKRYEKQNEYRNDISELTKMWLRARTTEERDSLTNAMVMLKQEMVEELRAVK